MRWCARRSQARCKWAGPVQPSILPETFRAHGPEDDALLLDLLDRGVAGFAPKTASGSIIEAAMRLILAGGRYLPPRLAEIASARIDDGSVIAVRDDVARITERLTERQMEVLRLIARGQSNKEIARALDLAPLAGINADIQGARAVLAASDAEARRQEALAAPRYAEHVPQC